MEDEWEFPHHVGNSGLDLYSFLIFHFDIA